MKLDFNVETPNFDKLINKTIENQKTVLWLSMLKMWELAKQKVPVNTGRLRNSINLVPNNKGALVYTLSDGVNYGIHVEFGTSPHSPPIDELKDWSRRVLGDENAAYAVARSIARAYPVQRGAKSLGRENNPSHL